MRHILQPGDEIQQVIVHPDIRPRTGNSAKALLLTILGEIVLPGGAEAWTATLLEAMGTAGIAEKNARQAIARLADQGLIESERFGRQVRWRLSVAGRTLLTEGAARIYGFLTRPAAWDGRWLIVIFSVPEEQRGRRHRLRQQLGFAGFGFPAAGVAVSTHLERELVAMSALRDLGIDDRALVFRGEAGSLAGDAELVQRAWDLEGLGRRYEHFVDAFAASRPRGERDVAGSLIRLVHEWRRFPFMDPELPADLLPRAWPGEEARLLFDRRRGQWVETARSWFWELDREQ